MFKSPENLQKLQAGSISILYIIESCYQIKVVVREEWKISVKQEMYSTSFAHGSELTSNTPTLQWKEDF